MTVWEKAVFLSLHCKIIRALWEMTEKGWSHLQKSIFSKPSPQRVKCFHYDSVPVVSLAGHNSFACSGYIFPYFRPFRILFILRVTPILLGDAGIILTSLWNRFWCLPSQCNLSGQLVLDNAGRKMKGQRKNYHYDWLASISTHPT